MGSKWVWVLMFVSLGWCLSQACLEEERAALLQLKQLFNGSDLSDWVPKNSNCCQWSYIQCNNSTNRVTELKLGYVRDMERGDYYLNMSLFSVFEELEVLQLYGNSIAGFVENGGLDKISKLSNLRALSLMDNNLKGIVDFSGPSTLSSLETLDLSGNKLNGTIHLQDLNSLGKLQWLYLEDNEIENVVFPKGPGALSSLTGLDLSDNKLNGIVDLQGISFHSNLRYLALDYNEIEEVIFSKGVEGDVIERGRSTE